MTTPPPQGLGLGPSPVAAPPRVHQGTVWETPGSARSPRMPSGGDQRDCWNRARARGPGERTSGACCTARVLGTPLGITWNPGYVIHLWAGAGGTAVAAVPGAQPAGSGRGAEGSGRCCRPAAAGSSRGRAARGLRPPAARPPARRGARGRRQPQDLPRHVARKPAFQGSKGYSVASLPPSGSRGQWSALTPEIWEWNSGKCSSRLAKLTRN